MKKLITIPALLLSISTFSQGTGFEKIKTTDKSFEFKAINHASMVFVMDGKSIYIDPYGSEDWYKGIDKADLVIITDIHPDHYSVETLKSIIGSNCRFVAPPAVAKLMPQEWQEKTHVVKNNQVINLDDLQITAIPMYNYPENPDSPHFKGRGNGYVLEWDDFRIYISGDTGPIPEMKSLRNIDMAFVCMNLPYTMSVEDAAEAVLTFRPMVVYPFHYRNMDKSLSDVNKFAELVGAGGVECTLLDWYPQ